MSIFTNIIGSFLKFGITVVGKRRLPRIEGELNLPGLHSSVEITRDQWGVPHINASNEHDLYFAQGFIHAQDRLWQMEMARRTTSGTLSELFGKIALDTDRIARTFGFYRLGKSDWETLEKDSRDVVEAYSKGVNAHINSLETKLPVEFSLIKHKPKLWKPEDTMGIMRYMVWSMSHGWYAEIIRAKLIEAVGEEHASKLEIEYPNENPYTLPKNIDFNKIDKDGNLIKLKGPFFNQNGGSNAWVISGKKSTTGNPILCNDMHLTLSLPSIWYQNHLKNRSERKSITGVSICGLPMVMVGHNDKITWGMTFAYTDAEDIFVEQFNKDNPTQYRFKGEWKEAEIIREEIEVKDDLNHLEKVYITHHGPVISDVLEGQTERLSISSMGLKPVNSLKGWHLLNKANTWNDFVTAMKHIDAPQLNVVYADVDGNIGHWVTGKVPIRKKGSGMAPVIGWSGEYEWTGEIPFEEMPHSLNPERGFIVTCNNKIVNDEYPHYLGSIWMNGYRAKVIEDYFDSLDKISIDDCKKMQLDFTCLPGMEFIKHFEDIKIQDPNPKVKEALEIMKSWDGQLTTDTVGGCLYEITRYLAVKHLLAPNLGEELTNTFMGQGFHPIILASHEFYGHDTVVLLRLLDEPDNWWVQHAGGKEKLLLHSFNRAFEYLMDNVGSNINNWTWGSVHYIDFPHSMSIKSPMDKVFNRGPFPAGGDTDTPCQMAIIPEDPFMVKYWAPSVRFINDMGDFARSITIYAPGQSGQLGSRHYDDLINDWMSGEYFPQLWTKGQIEQHSEGTLTLKP
ncbi:MAG: penicillin acylase family protein [Candidatus Kariarchaeaceae archaeon]|jgi:penicillin amidase